MSMIERENIGQSFVVKRSAQEVPDRAAALAGLLPPRRASEPVVTPASIEQPPAITAEEDATPSAVASPRPEKDLTRAPVSGGGGVAVIGVYLVPATLQRVREAAREQGLTYSDLLVKAFDHVDDQQLVTVFAPTPPANRNTGMPQRVTRRRGSPGIQINLRLSREQREWLDTKAVTVDAPSRSALVAEVFRLYLNSAWPGGARR